MTPTTTATIGEPLAAGQLPRRVWIGVTGHREINDEVVVAGQVSRVLNELIASWAPQHLELGVVSPLAEGADRLVARAVMAHPGAVLEVALPMQTERYLQDFETAESRAEFGQLMEAASLVTVLPATDRTEAYAEVGRYVVDRCDLLIAIWDGGHSRGYGGTAEVVALAREKGVPLIWINADGVTDVRRELLDRVDRHPEINEYNTMHLSRDRVVSETARCRRQLLETSRGAGLADPYIEPFLDWAVPCLVRADLLARRSQRRYRQFGSAMLGGSFLAITIATVQVLFFADRPGLVWFEAMVMLILLAVHIEGRRHRLHRRWLAHRCLAEQFRSTLFLGVVGLGQVRTDANAGRAGYDSHQWAPRLFEELWMRRPREQGAAVHISAIKRFMQRGWIDDQIDYNEHTQERNERADRVVRYAIGSLFAATLLVAIVHASEIHEGGQRWLELASILMPAAAATLHGARSQREFVRNAERSGGVLRSLYHLRDNLSSASDRQHVQAIATATSALLLAENQDWFGSMRYHDLEIHV